MMNNIENTTPSQRLRELRLKCNLNQSQMAVKLGFAKSYYSDIENNRRTVSKKTIEKLSLIFGASAEWLMFGKGEMFQQIEGKNDSNKLIEFIEYLERKNIQDSVQDDATFRANASMLFEIKEIVKKHNTNK
ncbi:helix-turn-helix domain-containing protein [Sphingobacterium cavernae]|uniref:helix-turn-helix domain-containing protein n=1 Tax=Sphingobacterium cavernae TaxID=2592657 RepID=UPI00122FE83A|nr:helix-turn-helix transcriptional regulator [Sphingobacterium cavernae]